MKSVTFIMEYGLVVILMNRKSNELTGHSKHHGKDSSNSIANSLQPWKDDVDRTAYLTFSIFYLNLVSLLVFYLV
jgi:hypothetical protein